MRPETMAAKISEKAKSFKRTIRIGITLANFDTPWCAPCRLQRSIIEQLAEEYKGKVQMTGFNVDDDIRLAMRLDITSVPTLIIFKNGQEIRRFIGLRSAETLSQAIDKALI